MKLRAKELCPIHRSRFCCGRKPPKPQRWKLNPYAIDHANYEANRVAERRRSFERVQRVDDPHHPRGYRELCSKAEMKRRLMIKLEQQSCICAICGQEITDFNNCAPDHIEPKGMGGGRRDDHIDNLQATHAACNLLKGSVRNYKPKAEASQ